MNPFTTYCAAFLLAMIFNNIFIVDVREYDVFYKLSGSRQGAMTITVKGGDKITQGDMAAYISSKVEDEVVVFEYKDLGKKYRWRWSKSS